MKSLILVLLGCLPLAVLTARSLQDLMTVEDPVADLEWEADWEPHASQAHAAGQQWEADQRAWELVRDTAWSEPRSPISPESLPLGSDFVLLTGSWSQWRDAMKLLAAASETQRIAAGDSLSDLEQALTQLEEVEDEFRLRPPPGGERLLELMEQQRQAIGQRIARLRLEGEAGRLFAQAQADIEADRFDPCLNLCGILLGERFAAIGASPILQSTRQLQMRAQFGKDARRLRERLRSTTAPAARRDAIKAFLASHSDRSALTPKETALVAEFERELAAAEAALAQPSAGASRLGTANTTGFFS